MLTVPKTRELQGCNIKTKRGHTDPVAFVIKDSNSLDTKLKTPDKMPELPALVDSIRRGRCPCHNNVTHCSFMFEPVRGGTRGGQAEFKWSDVSADKDREVSDATAIDKNPANLD